MAAGLAYDLIVLFWRMIINIFFREIRPRGAFNIPRDGPVLFICGPHANQFLDPLLLFSEVRKEAGRRVSILTAAKSMDRAFIGFIARLFDSIPVARAADYAKAGSGRLLLSEENPSIVSGIGTKFTSEVKPRSQLMLSKSMGYASATVESIESDTEIRLKGEFTVPSKEGSTNVKASGKIRTEGKDGLQYKVLPYVEQEATYGAVFEKLHDSGCIGVFPEGGSHDRTDFLPLKAGFSIMALGAKSKHPDLDVKLVPVGLSYFHAHKFRSRAVIEFGPPISVDPALLEGYNAGGAKKREACGKLLEQVHDGLRAVTLRAPDWETMQVIQAARRLYRTPGQRLTLGQTIELSKRFMEGYLHYQHEPRIIELRKRVIAYNRLLRDMGIADHQVERASNRSVKSLLLLVYRSGLLLWWSILSLPGVVLHAPVFILAKVISLRKAREALAASTVKIQARDVLATWKVLVSLAVVPLLYVFYTILASFLCYRYDWLPEWRWYVPIGMMCVLPSLGYSALKFGEAGMDVFKSLRPLFLSLVPGNEREVNKLREMREGLSNDISDIIAQLGPQLYENFDQVRILPSASVPQTGQAPGMLYRKGQATDSSVLSHPMLWLDERIFGWSRSAAVGASVWGQPGSIGRRTRAESTRSAHSSGPNSPEGSDYEYDEGEEEADVDYDDVLAITDVRRSTGRGDDGGGLGGPGQGQRTTDGQSGDSGSPVSPGASPRRAGRGRSYRDLKALRPGGGEAQKQEQEQANGQGGVPEPRKDDQGRNKLRLRKKESTENGSGSAGADGLSAGLDNGQRDK